MESMIAAVKDIECGMGQRQASRTYNVPVETSRRRVTGKVSMDCCPGPDTVLTEEEEDALMEYCLKMADMGFGLGREDAIRTAYLIAEKSGRKHPIKSEIAG